MLLIEGEADPNIADNDGRTPLHWASQNEYLEIVKMLLTEGGADPNIADRDDKTSLHIASYFNHLEIVKVLLLNGADPNIADHKNDTPLNIAYEGRYKYIVRLLRNYFPSLQLLSIRSIRKHKINIDDIPKELLSIK